MRLYAIAVLDSATQSYGQPFFANAPGQAMRSFSDAVNNPAKDTDVAKHPEDFELYQVGEFDTSTGKFISQDPVLLVRGKDYAQLPRD